jgi:hypothetical protein
VPAARRAPRRRGRGRGRAAARASLPASPPRSAAAAAPPPPPPRHNIGHHIYLGSPCADDMLIISAVLYAAAGIAPAPSPPERTSRPPPRKTLSQYDQVGAEVNGTLDIALLQSYLSESNSNTFSFLLWDTDGHQYLDMVRFLAASKDMKVGGAPLEVWVTLIPPTETEKWENKSTCARCPTTHPHSYGSQQAGVFCCNTTTNGADCSGDYCCMQPGSADGCQGVKRCGNNPENKTSCGAGNPGLPPHTSLCSIPRDSPLTPFNESSLVNHSQGFLGCNDYIGWGTILNKLAAQYPALVAVNIDDFVNSLTTLYTQTYVSRLHAALHAPEGRAVQLIPTHYYGGPGKNNFVLRKYPWLVDVTDGVLFYFMDMKHGQQICEASPLCGKIKPPKACGFKCLFGSCAEASLPNLADEIDDFRGALPHGHALHVGIYWSGYSSCGTPSPECESKCDFLALKPERFLCLTPLLLRSRSIIRWCMQIISRPLKLRWLYPL